MCDISVYLVTNKLCPKRKQATKTFLNIRKKKTQKYSKIFSRDAFYYL